MSFRGSAPNPVIQLTYRATLQKLVELAMGSSHVPGVLLGSFITLDSVNSLMNYCGSDHQLVPVGGRNREPPKVGEVFQN